jgi:hypothetical protein
MEMVLAIDGLYTTTVGLLRRAVYGRFNPAVVKRGRRDTTLLLHLANALCVAARDERPVPLN